MLEILILISLISVVGAVFKIVHGYKRQQERKRQIQEFEKEYTPSNTNLSDTSKVSDK